jgi:hypothetical protein
MTDERAAWPSVLELGSTYFFRRRRAYQRTLQAEGQAGSFRGLGGGNIILAPWIDYQSLNSGVLLVSSAAFSNSNFFILLYL